MTYSATISSKGQVTIPVEARRKLKLGKKVNFEIRDNEIAIKREPTLDEIRAALGEPTTRTRKVTRGQEKGAWAQAAVEKYRKKRGY